MGWSKAWLPEEAGCAGQAEGAAWGAQRRRSSTGVAGGHKQIGEIRDYGFKVITLRPIH